MIFEEWYPREYPDIDPEHDDFYKHLKECWRSAYIAGYKQGALDDIDEYNCPYPIDWQEKS